MTMTDIPAPLRALHDERLLELYRGYSEAMLQWFVVESETEHVYRLRPPTHPMDYFTAYGPMIRLQAQFVMSSDCLAFASNGMTRVIEAWADQTGSTFEAAGYGFAMARNSETGFIKRERSELSTMLDNAAREFAPTALKWMPTLGPHGKFALL